MHQYGTSNEKQDKTDQTEQNMSTQRIQNQASQSSWHFLSSASLHINEQRQVESNIKQQLSTITNTNPNPKTNLNQVKVDDTIDKDSSEVSEIQSKPTQIQQQTQKNEQSQVVYRQIQNNVELQVVYKKNNIIMTVIQNKPASDTHYQLRKRDREHVDQQGKSQLSAYTKKITNKEMDQFMKGIFYDINSLFVHLKQTNDIQFNTVSNHKLVALIECDNFIVESEQQKPCIKKQQVQQEFFINFYVNQVLPDHRIVRRFCAIKLQKMSLNQTQMDKIRQKKWNYMKSKLQTLNQNLKQIKDQLKEKQSQLTVQISKNYKLKSKIKQLRHSLKSMQKSTQKSKDKNRGIEEDAESEQLQDQVLSKRWGFTNKRKQRKKIMRKIQKQVQLQRNRKFEQLARAAHNYSQFQTQNQQNNGRKEALVKVQEDYANLVISHHMGEHRQIEKRKQGQNSDNVSNYSEISNVGQYSRVDKRMRISSTLQKLKSISKNQIIQIEQDEQFTNLKLQDQRDDRKEYQECRGKANSNKKGENKRSTSIKNIVNDRIQNQLIINISEKNNPFIRQSRPGYNTSRNSVFLDKQVQQMRKNRERTGLNLYRNNKIVNKTQTNPRSSTSQLNRDIVDQNSHLRQNKKETVSKRLKNQRSSNNILVLGDSYYNLGKQVQLIDSPCRYLILHFQVLVPQYRVQYQYSVEVCVFVMVAYQIAYIMQTISAQGYLSSIIQSKAIKCAVVILLLSSVFYLLFSLLMYLYSHVVFHLANAIRKNPYITQFIVQLRIQHSHCLSVYSREYDPLIDLINKDLPSLQKLTVSYPINKKNCNKLTHWTSYIRQQIQVRLVADFKFKTAPP